ncbi:transcription factor GAGA, partial [Hyalella azteca]|uniref:Transcription factor GAGA n=1 Tax=Hyalella azteca TaxID=294128 RepID=A0A8B7NNA9_HYAAZ
MAGRIAKVRWAAHGREMSSHLSSIYSNLGAESDCVIASEGGRRFPAHRVVLAMASPFFSRIFATMTPDVVNPLIVLDGVEADHVEALMQYMYSGYSIVKCEKLPGLCRTAKILCIKEFPSLEVAPSVKRHTDDRAEVVEVTDEKNSIPRSSLERRLEADKYQMFHAPRRDQGTDKTFQPDFKKIKTCLDETRQPLEMNQRTESPRPSYGKPLSEFSLLTAPLAGESKLREALRVPVTAAQSTSQSVETKAIKQEDPPELVDVCSVSDDEAVKDRLA